MTTLTTLTTLTAGMVRVVRVVRGQGDVLDDLRRGDEVNDLRRGDEVNGLRWAPLMPAALGGRTDHDLLVEDRRSPLIVADRGTAETVIQPAPSSATDRRPSGTRRLCRIPSRSRRRPRSPISATYRRGRLSRDRGVPQDKTATVTATSLTVIDEHGDRRSSRPPRSAPGSSPWIVHGGARRRVATKVRWSVGIAGPAGDDADRQRQRSPTGADAPSTATTSAGAMTSQDPTSMVGAMTSTIIEEKGGRWSPASATPYHRRRHRMPAARRSSAASDTATKIAAPPPSVTVTPPRAPCIHRHDPGSSETKISDRRGQASEIVRTMVNARVLRRGACGDEQADGVDGV